jgi:hypothetical protein
MARLIAELILVLLIGAILFVAYRGASGRQFVDAQGAPEFDVSLTPSTWFTDSRTTDDGHTEVCIIRVENKSGVVLERRILSRLDNSAPGYTAALDTAMDEAYGAMRVANVNLNRR